MTEKRPWIALLGWFPPVYIIGLIHNFGKPWCTPEYGGWISFPNPIPVLWWPTRLFNKKRRQR